MDGCGLARTLRIQYSCIHGAIRGGRLCRRAARGIKLGPKLAAVQTRYSTRKSVSRLPSLKSQGLGGLLPRTKDWTSTKGHQKSAIGRPAERGRKQRPKRCEEKKKVLNWSLAMELPISSYPILSYPILFYPIDPIDPIVQSHPSPSHPAGSSILVLQCLDPSFDSFSVFHLLTTSAPRPVSALTPQMSRLIPTL